MDISENSYTKFEIFIIPWDVIRSRYSYCWLRNWNDVYINALILLQINFTIFRNSLVIFMSNFATYIYFFALENLFLPQDELFYDFHILIESLTSQYDDLAQETLGYSNMRLFEP